jgi:hypothetical protein
LARLPTRVSTNDVKLGMKIAGGALMPSVATILFNLLNFVFDNYEISPKPTPSESTFDIAVGCALAILGICLTAPTQDTSNRLILLLIAILLLIIGAELLAPVFLHWSKMLMVGLVDLVAFFSVAWAIWIAG